MVSQYDERNHLVQMGDGDYEYDNETGQYYYRARMYSPVQSRFLSSDPMGMVDGPNMYAYARNDPVNHRDPSGCMSVPPSLVNGGGGSGSGDVSSEELGLGDTATQGTGTSGGTDGGNGDSNGGRTARTYQYMLCLAQCDDDFINCLGSGPCDPWDIYCDPYTLCNHMREQCYVACANKYMPPGYAPI